MPCYRHAITIEKNTKTRTASGGEADSWSTHATVFASIEPIRGREFFAARETQSEVTHRVRLHYVADVTPRMRVKHGTRYLYITSAVNVNEEGRELELLCAEKV